MTRSKRMADGVEESDWRKEGAERECWVASLAAAAVHSLSSLSAHLALWIVYVLIELQAQNHFFPPLAQLRMMHSASTINYGSLHRHRQVEVKIPSNASLIFLWVLAWVQERTWQLESFLVLCFWVLKSDWSEGCKEVGEGMAVFKATMMYCKW